MNAGALIAEIVRSPKGDYFDETLLSNIENWDSLKGVRLVLRLEEVMGRPLSEQDIEALRSVGDVQRLLEQART
jgi:acyl carrier protein